MSISKRTIYGGIALLCAALGCAGVGILLFTSLNLRPSQPTENIGLATDAERNQESSEVKLPKNSDGSYRLPATYEGWYPLGTGAFTIEIKGSIDFGGQLASPDRSPILGSGEALVPGVPFGVPVAKIGEEGKPFMIGYSHRFETKGQTAFIAVNDSYYADNKGTYMIYKR